MPRDLDVRRIALSMPEAYEAAHFDLTSFRVARKICCTMAEGAPRIMLKFDPEDQRNLVADDPATIRPAAWLPGVVG
jgi:predicted DNA-binding protein (MmcQ/YjbR family)